MRNRLIKILGASLFCMSSIITTPALSSNLPVDQHTFQIGSTIDYELPANEPQVFSNIFRWAVAADCKIIHTDTPRDISFKVLRKKASVNDILLSRGESILATVQPDESFRLSVDAGGTVELTNFSEKAVLTRCTAATEVHK